MLFVAMQASIVTSAMAMEAIIPMRHSNAIIIGSLSNVETTNVVATPNMPV